MKNNFLKLYWVVFVVLMAAPALLLVERRADNLCFYTLLLLGLVMGAFRLRPSGFTFSRLLKEYWPLHLAMAGMLLAIFINQLVLQDFVIRTYDYPSRLAFFVVLVWVALLLPYRLMRYLQWAYVVGAFLAAAKMYVGTKDGILRMFPDFIPLIPFSQMAQLLGFFSILSIGYDERKTLSGKLSTGLKLLVGIFGIYGAYLSQTRGAWIAIPAFLIIVILILGRRVAKAKLLAWFAVAVILLGVLFGSTNLVQQRVVEAKQNLTQYQNSKNLDTSVGVRLQLWNAALRLYSEHPLVGVGRNGYDAAMSDLEHRKIVTATAQSQPHSHNEVLYNMATLGSFGLLGILCLYLVPGFYFWRDARSTDREIRTTAGMGLLLCSGFLIFGLTDVMFVWGTSANFYSILAAILFAFIIKRKAALSSN
ncbi:MAG: O-antigen ligase family protein [Herbaspirillum sp.]